MKDVSQPIKPKVGKNDSDIFSHMEYEEIYYVEEVEDDDDEEWQRDSALGSVTDEGAKHILKT